MMQHDEVARTAAEKPRILFVDDNAEFRSVFRRGLEAHGFSVIEVESAEAAIRAGETIADKIDLAVMDIDLGDGWGAPTAAHLRQLVPGLPVIYISGHAANDPILRQGIEPHMTFLEKPFELGTLISAVRHTLAGLMDRAQGALEDADAEQ